MEEDGGGEKVEMNEWPWKVVTTPLLVSGMEKRKEERKEKKKKKWNWLRINGEMKKEIKSLV